MSKLNFSEVKLMTKKDFILFNEQEKFLFFDTLNELKKRARKKYNSTFE